MVQDGAPSAGRTRSACIIVTTELDGMAPDLTWDDEGTCLAAYRSWSENNNLVMNERTDTFGIGGRTITFRSGRLRGHRRPHHRLARLLLLRRARRAPFGPRP